MAATVTRREPMPRAVKFDRYGGTDVLRVVEVDRPVPGPQQVLIGMKAAGISDIFECQENEIAGVSLIEYLPRIQVPT
jgi:hypothetical protein